MEGFLKYAFYFVVFFVLMTQVFPFVKENIQNRKSEVETTLENDIVYCELEVTNLNSPNLLASVNYDQGTMNDFESEKEFFTDVDNAAFSNVPEILNKMVNQDWRLTHSFTEGQKNDLKLRFLFQKTL